MNLLIIRLSSMGDVILVSSVLSWLHHNRPEANLFLLTSDIYVPLFVDDPRLSGVIGVQKGRVSQLQEGDRSRSWNHIIDLQNSKKSAKLCRTLFPRLPRSTFDKLHLARALLLTTRLNVYNHERTVAVRYLEAARKALFHLDNDRRAGKRTRFALDEPLSAPPALKLHFDEPAEKMKQFIYLGTKPALALFPFAAWKNKQWPLERYAAVGRHFRDHGWQVIIFGGAADRAQSSQLVRRIGERCIDLTGQTSLYEAGWVLKQASLALGNDTGLSHLARACGVPGGMIFGSTTHHLGFFPYGRPSFVVFQEPLWCRPCHAHGGNSCWRGNRPCLGAITEQRVIQKLEQLWLLCAKQKNNSSDTET